MHGVLHYHHAQLEHAERQAEAARPHRHHLARRPRPPSRWRRAVAASLRSAADALAPQADRQARPA
jgi:hypothetical protein